MNTKWKSHTSALIPSEPSRSLKGEWVVVPARGDVDRATLDAYRYSYKKRYRSENKLFVNQTSVFDARTAVNLLRSDPAPTKALLDILSLE